MSSTLSSLPIQVGNLRSGLWDHSHAPWAGLFTFLEPQCPDSETGQCTPCSSFSVGRYQSDTHTFTITASTSQLTLLREACSYRPHGSLWSSELTRKPLSPKMFTGSPALRPLHSWLPRCFLSPPHFRWTLGFSLWPWLLSLGLSSYRSLPFSQLRPPLPHMQVTDLQSNPSASCRTCRAHCKIKMKTRVQKLLGIAGQQTKPSIKPCGAPSDYRPYTVR